MLVWKLKPAVQRASWMHSWLTMLGALFEETDPDVLARLAKIAEKTDLVERTKFISFVPASEDCTWLIRRVREHGGKAGYFLFGCNHQGHHKGDFSIQDDKTLPAAFEILTRYLAERNAGD